MATPRPVNVVNYYTTDNVNAMDAAAFEEYLVRNPVAMASGMANAILGGNADYVRGALRLKNS